MNNRISKALELSYLLGTAKLEEKNASILDAIKYSHKEASEALTNGETKGGY